VSYHVERLPNGLIRVFDRGSNLAGLYDAEGNYHSGDLYAATLGELVGELLGTARWLRGGGGGSARFTVSNSSPPK
jgi:hypothetical protein